jgi:hypothetical protein
MSSIPKELVHFLTDNEQVLSYSESQIKRALSLIGIHDEAHLKGQTEWTIIDHIKNRVHQTFCSWERIRLGSTLHFLQRLTRWEESAHDCVTYESMDDIHLQIHIANIKSFELLDEIVALRAELNGKYFNILKHSVSKVSSSFTK